MGDALCTIEPWDKRAWGQVDALLEREGIRRDGNLDYTCGIFDGDMELVATGSSFGGALRCLAVDKRRQGEGLLNRIVSHLVQRQAERGLSPGGCADLLAATFFLYFGEEMNDI